MEVLLHFNCLLGSIKRGPACVAHTDSQFYCPNNIAKQICKRLYGHCPILRKGNFCLLVFLVIWCRESRMDLKFPFWNCWKDANAEKDTNMQANINNHKQLDNINVSIRVRVAMEKEYFGKLNTVNPNQRRCGLCFKLSLLERLLVHMCLSLRPHSTPDALGGAWCL